MKRRNFLWCSLFFAASCTTTTNTRSSHAAVTLPKVLRFAVTDAQGLEELQQDFEPFRAALAEVLETNIEFFPVEDLIAAVPAMLANQVDLIWAGPSEYVLLKARAQALPVVALKRSNYRTAIIAPATSQIKSLSDLKGKTLDVYRMGGAASHLGAIKLLLEANLEPSEVKIIASDERSLMPLKMGKVDAQSMSLPGYRERLVREGFSEQDFVVLAQGALLPGDAFVVSSHLDTAVITAIRERMLQHQEQLIQAIVSIKTLAKRFEGAVFEMANDTDYDIVREVYRVIGQAEVIQ